MGSLSIWHWLIVLLIVVMVFGTRKLRNIGQDLGGAVRDFREGVRSAEKPETLADTPPSRPDAVDVEAKQTTRQP